MGTSESSAEATAEAAVKRIFLSYARADLPKVQQLAENLEEAGHEVWWDRRIGGGAEFAKEIETALAAADIVLVAWSSESLHSHWVRDEAAAGRDTGRLLPVSLDGSQPPLGFRQFQTIDLSGWNGRSNSAEFKALVGALWGTATAPGTAKPEPRERVPRKRLLRLSAAAAAAAAVVGVALYWPSPSEAVAAPELEIAKVEAVSSALDPQVASELRQELRTALATDSAIAVTSAERNGQSKARFALTATVNRAGEALKLAVELADRDSGITLWSKMFELPAARPELVPRQAAYKVATVVRCGLSSRSKQLQGTALAQWLTLCDQLWGDPNSTLDRLLSVARNATEAAPQFSEAWSARAMAAAPVPGQTAQGEVEALRKEAAEAAERALELDPENGEAYAAKAFLLPAKDYAGREALLKKSISVRPTDCVCQEVFYAQFLMSLGRIQEAYEHFGRVHEMRPLSPIGSSGQAHALFLLGREDDARALLSEARELWPDDEGLKMMLLRSSIWTGRYDEGLALLRDPDFKVPQPRREPWLVALEALKSGNPAQRQKAVETVVAATRKPGWNNMVAISALAALGAKAEALDAAKRFVDVHEQTGSMVLFEPTLADLRATPEFARLVQQLGMTRYWAQSGEQPDFCHSAAGPACRSA